MPDARIARVACELGCSRFAVITIAIRLGLAMLAGEVDGWVARSTRRARTTC